MGRCEPPKMGRLEPIIYIYIYIIMYNKHYILALLIYIYIYIYSVSFIYILDIELVNESNNILTLPPNNNKQTKRQQKL